MFAVAFRSVVDDSDALIRGAAQNVPSSLVDASRRGKGRWGGGRRHRGERLLFERRR